MIRDLAAELEALLASDSETKAPPAGADTRGVTGQPEGGLAEDEAPAQAQRYLYAAPPLPEKAHLDPSAGALSEQTPADAAVPRSFEVEPQQPLRGSDTHGRVAEMLAARQAERLRRGGPASTASAGTRDPEPEYAPVPENWGMAVSEPEAVSRRFSEDDSWTTFDPSAAPPEAAVGLNRKRAGRPRLRRIALSAASLFVLLAASAVAGQYVIGLDNRTTSGDPNALAAAGADDVADDPQDSAPGQQANDNPQRVDMAGAATTWDEPSEATSVGDAPNSASGSTYGSAQAAESGADIRNVTPQGSADSEEGDPAIPSAEEAVRPEQGAEQAASDAGFEEPGEESAFGDAQDAAAEAGESNTASQAVDSFGQSEPESEEAAAPSDEPDASDGGSRALNSAVGPATLARVTTHVNMRDAPDNDGEVIAVIPAEADIDLVDCDVWCEIVYDGQQGWVYQDFVETGEGVSTADS